MKTVKKWSIFFLVVSFVLSCGTAQKVADKDTKKWSYEIEPVNVGTAGTVLIKVWSYSTKPAVAIEQAKKNAVHGIIFTGFVGMNNINRQPALADNANLEEEQKAFFDSFFDEGKYAKYVSITNDGSIAAKDRLKVGKKYKIGVIVSVDVERMKKDLRQAGIIKKIGAGFSN